MKSLHYVKKYSLDKTDRFNQQKFVLDLGNDFLSRLEVYKTQCKTWSYEKFWSLYAELENKWLQIEKRIPYQLPKDLWDYIYREIVIPTLETEFPGIKKEKNAIDQMNIKDLKWWLLNTGLHEAMHVEIEWDHQYQENAIGELNYRPNFAWENLRKGVEERDDHVVWYAFDELTRQLSKVAAAKAKIQFRIHAKRRNDAWNNRSFSWDEFLGYFFSTSTTVDPREYVDYFQTIQLGAQFLDTTKRSRSRTSRVSSVSYL